MKFEIRDVTNTLYECDVVPQNVAVFPPHDNPIWWVGVVADTLVVTLTHKPTVIVLDHDNNFWPQEHAGTIVYPKKEEKENADNKTNV